MGGVPGGSSLPCGPPLSLLTQPTGPALGRPETWGQKLELGWKLPGALCVLGETEGT